MDNNNRGMVAEPEKQTIDIAREHLKKQCEIAAAEHEDAMCQFDLAAKNRDRAEQHLVLIRGALSAITEDRMAVAYDDREMTAVKRAY